MRRDGSTESLRYIAQIVCLDFGHFCRNNLCECADCQQNYLKTAFHLAQNNLYISVDCQACENIYAFPDVKTIYVQAWIVGI
jgi:hypothetical protein